MSYVYCSSDSDKEDLIKKIYKDNPSIIDSYCYSNQLWTIEQKEPVIGLYILSKNIHNGESCWGYKQLYESMNPAYYGCPIHFLNQVPEKCLEWRQMVNDYHKNKNTLRINFVGIHPGSRVTLDNGWELTVLEVDSSVFVGKKDGDPTYYRIDKGRVKSTKG